MYNKIQNKIDQTMVVLIQQSRALFEEQLRVYSQQMRMHLIQKEGEMRPQTLDAKFDFNFTARIPYTTESGPLFPPLPTLVIPPRTTPVATHDYRLRRSARKPAGYYSK